MIFERKMRPQRNVLGWTGMEHSEHKNMTCWDVVPLLWNQIFNKREDFFAATNGRPNSTALALSLQVCVATVTGTPRTQECFSLQANNIKQTIYTHLPNQNLNPLENIYRRNSPHLVKLTITKPDTRIYTHYYGKACSVRLQEQTQSSVTPVFIQKNKTKTKKHTQTTQTHPTTSCLSQAFPTAFNELKATKFSKHLLLKVHFKPSSCCYLYTYTHHSIFKTTFYMAVTV